MRTVNRMAILVRPKQPYLDWAASIDDDAPGHLDTIENHTSVYLVQEVATLDDEARVLRAESQTIFDAELESWHRAEEDWPPGRNFTMFEEWFDAKCESLVFDLAEEAIEVDG